MTDSTHPADADPRTMDELPPVLDVITDAEIHPTAYTFVPRTATDDERTTTWMTARADSVAHLERWR